LIGQCLDEFALAFTDLGTHLLDQQQLAESATAQKENRP